MKNVNPLALILSFVFGVILAAATVGSIAYVHVVTHNTETKNATNEILLEHAISTCEYGSEMFYVARNVSDALTLAQSDCKSYLTDNGAEWFINFYGIQE